MSHVPMYIQSHLKTSGVSLSWHEGSMDMYSRAPYCYSPPRPWSYCRVFTRPEALRESYFLFMLESFSHDLVGTTHTVFCEHRVLEDKGTFDGTVGARV